jgi:putative PIN family toxin of toxin-antitoxin system
MVAAVRSSGGASRRLLEAALKRRFETLLSVPLMFEYEAVLKRREHLTAAGLERPAIDAILDRLVQAATTVKLGYSWRPVMQDPNDEMVLETAVNGLAEVIVTFNIRHLRHAAARFGIATVPPNGALQILGV